MELLSVRRLGGRWGSIIVLLDVGPGPGMGRKQRNAAGNVLCGCDESVVGVGVR